MKVVNKYFLGRKKYNTCVQKDRRTQSESLSHTLIAVYYLYGEFLLGFLQPIIWFAWFRDIFWYISESSHVCTSNTQPRWIPPEGPTGNEHQLTSLPFDLQGTFCMLARRSPDLEHEKYVVSYILSEQSPTFSVCMCQLLSHVQL